MHARSPLLLATSQGLPIHSHGVFASLGLWRLPEKPLRPGAECGFDSLPIHAAQDGMEGGSTGRAMRKAQSLHQRCTIMASPLRNGRVTPVATQHGTTGESEDRSQRVAFAVGTPAIRELSQHLDQWTCLWDHRSSSSKALWLV